MRDFHTWPFGVGVSDGFLFIILKFLFIGLILGAIILILKLILGDSFKRDTPPDPLEVLKIRLAKGEVSEEEYSRLRSIIIDKKNRISSQGAFPLTCW